MTSTRSCRFCGSEELERSEHKGELTCCRCGAVLEESGIVESLQFAESSAGGIAMVGRFVPSGGTGRGIGIGSGEAREQSLQRGLSCIQSVAERLRLSPQHVSSAHRLYLMASQRNFSVGRRAAIVAGAALYVICRRERTPHLLIDFADVLRVSVRSLGQVFIRLLRVLHLQVPSIDLSLFLDRFAARLNLGDKTTNVTITAARIIQAMERDWISTGRRPTGLCGASLLIAARYHGIQIDAEEVAAVVRLSGSTLTKRLYEFRRSAVARISVENFERTDLAQLPQMELPPCRLAKRKQQQQQQEEEKGKQERIEDEAAAAEAAAEPCTASAAVYSSKPVAPESPAAAAATATAGSGIAAAAAAALEDGPDQETEGRVFLRQGEGTHKEVPSSGEILSAAGWIVGTISSAALPAAAAAAADTAAGDTAAGEAAAAGNTLDSAGAPAAAAAAADEGEQGETVLNGDRSNPLADLLRSVRARADELLSPEEARSAAASPGSRWNSAGHSAAAPPAAAAAAAALAAGAAAAAGEAEEEGSDEDLGDMLLNDKEREAKALIWDDLTRDIMPAVHRRLRQQKLKKEQQQQPAAKKRRFQPRGTAALAAATSAAESVRLSLEKKGKGLAQRIDDEALEAFFAARKVVEM